MTIIISIYERTYDAFNRLPESTYYIHIQYKNVYVCFLEWLFSINASLRLKITFLSCLKISIFFICSQIDWYDPWLIGLVLGHILTTVTAIVSRNHSSIQIILFLVMRKIMCHRALHTIHSFILPYLNNISSLLLSFTSAACIFFRNNKRVRSWTLAIIF